MNNFCLKIGFFQAQHAMSDFCFFFKDRCFYASFFLICFHRSSPQFLLETKRFASIKNCSRFSALRFTGDLQLKNFSKNDFFFNFLFFFKCFRLRKMGFLLFPVEEEWFSRYMRIHSGIFWRCKIDEILTVILHLVLRAIFIWFYSKVRNFLRKCLRSTASPLCCNLLMILKRSVIVGNDKYTLFSQVCV